MVFDLANFSIYHSKVKLHFKNQHTFVKILLAVLIIMEFKFLFLITFLKEVVLIHGFILHFKVTFLFGHLELNFKIEFLRVLNIVVLFYSVKFLVILFPSNFLL